MTDEIEASVLKALEDGNKKLITQITEGVQKIVHEEVKKLEHIILFPHKFNVITRTFCAFIGSIVPIGISLLQSGILKRIDDNNIGTGYFVFYTIWAVLIAAWIWGMHEAVTSEQKSLSKYFLLGSVYPANAYVIMLAFQVLE